MRVQFICITGRKIVCFGFLGNASLESALYSIPSQVICSFITFTIQKDLCFLDSNFSQLMEVSSVHFVFSRNQVVSFANFAPAQECGRRGG